MNLADFVGFFYDVITGNGFAFSFPKAWLNAFLLL
jgi:hypothetical protein